MNEINKTLFIPLYGKAQVSRKNIILKDQKAQEIWGSESFPIKGKAKSKWLAYYMAMRARVFDDWTDEMLRKNREALVLHIGCGLDSRCLRVREKYVHWIDADFPDVILQRRKYFNERENYHMAAVDASKTEDIAKLPDSSEVIVILEGISMYLEESELQSLFRIIQEKYLHAHLMVDVYTEFAAKVSKYKNPVNAVGVTKLYGVDNMERIISDTRLEVKSEPPMTPDNLINELRGFESVFFRKVFSGKIAQKLYMLYELEC